MTKRAEVHEDLTLARRAAAGDETAMCTIYRRHADPLFAFIIHRLGGHRSDAEDVFQDTWLSALRSLPKYRGRNRIFFWLCGIARHKIADRYYRRAGEAGGDGTAAPGQPIGPLLDDAPLAEDVLARIDTRLLVLEALALLSDEHRAVLIARYVDDRSVGEVAEALGRTYKATESLLSRARAALQEALLAREHGGGTARGSARAETRGRP